MTPWRRFLERIVFALLAVTVLTGPGRASAAMRTARETVAYVPAAIWGDYLGPATGELNLTPHAIYWFDGADSSMGRVLGDLERYQADDVRAAPREPMVAFVGRYAAYPSNKLVPGVAVMDTAGVLLIDFPMGQSFAWSPDGTRLAVVLPRQLQPASRARAGRGAAKRPRKAEPRYRAGVMVWDRRDGSVRTVLRYPSRAAWAGNDSLLLQYPDSVLVLEPRSGVVKRASFHGTVVSPDSRYAMWPGENGENTRVYDETKGEAITDALFAPFRQEDKTQIRSAFWARGRGADHLMVISGCDGIQYPEPSCRTRVIDVASGEVLKSFKGEALGPTADGRGVVVFRRDKRRLTYYDLRPIAQGRGNGRITAPGVTLEPESESPAPRRDRDVSPPRKDTPPDDSDWGTPDDSDPGTFY